MTTEEYESLYRKALSRCFNRYLMKALVWNHEDIEKFCDEAASKLEEGYSIPKLCRWLGYIQGVLVERGVTTVEAERDWTRPLFRPLDFMEENGR